MARYRLPGISTLTAAARSLAHLTLLCVAGSGCGDDARSEKPPCAEVTIDVCESTPGCRLLPGGCFGTPLPCDQHTEQPACEQTGCTWSGDACIGEPPPCEQGSASCESYHSGCAFDHPACADEE